MKISNETKVGALTAIAITILILGYNFLKGNDNIFAKGTTLYAIYDKIDGLTPSNPVMINGYKIGKVSEVVLDPITLKIKVKFDIKTDLNIPKNSLAKIYAVDLFGAKAIEIKFGDSKSFVQDGDILASEFEIALTDKMSTTLAPLQVKIDNILGSIDSLLSYSDISATVKTLNSSLISFKNTSDELQETIKEITPKLSKIFGDVESITTNLKNNNEKINNAIANTAKFSDKLVSLKMEQTVENANKALADFSVTLNKINSGQGTLGMLANDDKLYKELGSASKNLSSLIDNINKYPKRYISLGGRKKDNKKYEEDTKTVQ